MKRRGTGSPSPQRPSGSSSACRASLKCPARARASTAPPSPAASRLRTPSGRSAATALRDALGGVVHVLQDAVAEHDVVAAALDHVEEAVGVALDAPHPVGDPGLGGAALQREQRVRAGVDDGDAVAEAGDGHREVAAAAPGVEDVERLPSRGLDPAVEGVLEDLPDHGGTEGGAGAGQDRSAATSSGAWRATGWAHRVRHGSDSSARHRPRRAAGAMALAPAAGRPRAAGEAARCPGA